MVLALSEGPEPPKKLEQKCLNKKQTKNVNVIGPQNRDHVFCRVLYLPRIQYAPNRTRQIVPVNLLILSNPAMVK